MIQKKLVLAGLLLLGGCAKTNLDSAPSLSVDHPANINAPEAPYIPAPNVLTSPAQTIPPPNAASQPGTQAQATEYTCPMHPTYVQKVPGRCPICGMNLVQKSGSSMGEHHD